MESKNDTPDWLSSIAKRAAVESSRVTEILAAHRIQPSPVVSSPRHLLIQEIAFSGTKVGIARSGPFAFHWNDLHRGLWGTVTESNLKGKSSIIEVVRWLLRGKQGLQADVFKWIERASLRFQLDANKYRVFV